jgi:glutamyl-tRNA synthetase
MRQWCAFVWPPAQRARSISAQREPLCSIGFTPKAKTESSCCRIEDTDKERSKPEFTQNILEGLQWLGIDWSEDPVIQSERVAQHRDAIRVLLDKGLAYRCYANESELATMRDAQKASNQPPRYDNRHRHLTAEQEAAFQAEGRDAVIRFRINDDAEIHWNDLVRGTMRWRGGDLGGDMVVARRAPADQIGDPLYNLGGCGRRRRHGDHPRDPW